MRNIAGFALGMAALFFAIVAVLVNAPGLFYIGTALIMTIAVSRLQAWLSVQGLLFQRTPVDPVRVGDTATMQIIVQSERRIKRPLIAIEDELPARLIVADRSPSTPIAASQEGTLTQYTFKPRRRGVFHWSSLYVQGTDALGLVMMAKKYATEPFELTVLPRPIPVDVDMPLASGWGLSEAESGQSRGAGLEPRGIREYAHGDSLRHVHWPSSARRNQLLVKEFEAGSPAAAVICLQTTSGSDLGTGVVTSLDLMCGHAAFIIDQLVLQGAKVEFPTHGEPTTRGGVKERQNEIYVMLAKIQADRPESLGTQILGVLDKLTPGSIVLTMLSVADPTLPIAALRLRQMGVQVVALLYDADAFGSRKQSLEMPATYPAYLEELRGAGVHTSIMPTKTEER